MASLFDKINAELRVSGIKPRTIAAQTWLRNRVSAIRMPTNRSNVLNDAKRISAKAFIGRMYFFHYDPKFKDILPVWDMFPLVIPMETYPDGFLAMNLHYLDPGSRLLLLDKL